MADLTILQGQNLPISIDATNFGAITALQVELSINGNAEVKFKYPETEGYNLLIIDGNNYTAILTTEITNAMLGLYRLEITAFNGDQEIAKQDKKDFLQVNQQSV